MNACLLYFFLEFQIITYSGRFHPLLVHLPIGILLFSFIISLFNERQRASMDKAWLLSSYLVAIFSLLSVITGFCLSKNGDYENSLIVQHQWAAISSSIISICILLFKSQKRWLTWLNMLSIIITGHFGGTLTHGALFGEKDRRDVTNSTLIEQGETFKANDRSDTSMDSPNIKLISYELQVQPLLREKCYGCHSEIKKKGGLRLETKELIEKGGRKGKIFKAGHPEISKLYKYLVLPTNDELHMPPKGKKQMNQAEILLIKKWILSGALFEQVSMEPKSQKIPIDTVFKEKYSGFPIPIKKQQGELSEINRAVFESLEKKGISISSSRYNPSGWSVSFVNLPIVSNSDLAALKSLGSSLFELDLSNHELAGSDLMKEISSFKNLRVLKLGNTGLDNYEMRGVEEFPDLEVLNVYGNPVSDLFVENLKQCKKMKRVYLWKTQVSAAAIQELGATMKNTCFLGNNLELIKQDSNSTKK